MIDTRTKRLTREDALRLLEHAYWHEVRHCNPNAPFDEWQASQDTLWMLARAGERLRAETQARR